MAWRGGMLRKCRNVQVDNNARLRILIIFSIIRGHLIHQSNLYKDSIESKISLKHFALKVCENHRSNIKVRIKEPRPHRATLAPCGLFTNLE